VWDFADDRSPSRPFNRALSALGIEPPQLPGTPESTLEGMQDLFAGAGLQDIASRAIDGTCAFRDFDTFWRTQTPLMHPVGKLVAAMSEPDRAALKDAVRKEVPMAADGTIAYAARANAVMGRVPR